MTEDDSIDDVKKSTAVVGELIKAAGTSEEAKQASSNIGKSAVVITESINNILLPLAALNFGVKKAREYFETRFPDQLAKKLKDIPESKLIEPSMKIAGPALQGLVFTHDERVLRDLYLALIATSMTKGMSETAHPSFVELIRQMSSHDASLLGDLCIGGYVESELPIIEIRSVKTKDSSYDVLQKHVTPLRTDSNPEPLASPEVILSNLVRLGVVNIEYSHYISEAGAYDWAKIHPTYLQYENIKHEGKKIVFERGALSVTAIGVQFVKALGLH